MHQVHAVDIVVGALQCCVSGLHHAYERFVEVWLVAVQYSTPLLWYY